MKEQERLYLTNSVVKKVVAEAFNSAQAALDAPEKFIQITTTFDIPESLYTSIIETCGNVKKASAIALVISHLTVTGFFATVNEIRKEMEDDNQIETIFN
jgi:hypothetical protein